MTGPSLAEKMAHCPGCQKPVLNAGQFWSHAEFSIRCPWCQSNIQITIEPKITVKSLKPEEKTDDGNAQNIQSMQVPPEGGLKIIGYIYPESQKTKDGQAGQNNQQS